MSKSRRDRRPEPSERVRWRVLTSLERRLEVPMAVLGLIWLALFVVEAVRGLDPVLTGLSLAIWGIFVADFVLRFLLAPDKLRYLRASWFTALALLIPALRVARIGAVLRAARIARASRGLRLVRTVASLNRGMGALSSTMRRRGVGYVVMLTIAVCLGGAAGMLALEPVAAAGGARTGFSSYGDAVWWTAMIMTTFGSGYWPVTGEGRLLAFLLSLYAIGVFGYITATLASFFIDRDAASGETAVAGASELAAIQRDLAALRAALAPRLDDGTAPERASTNR